MSASEGKSLEKNENATCLNIADKFRAYKLFVEFTKTKLKERETVIEQLKNEINISRNSEKNLTSQISSTQNRLISLQETVKKFINVSDQQRQNEKMSQRIHERVEEFEEDIKTIRKKSESLLQSATRELDLLKKIKKLESVLDKKNSECDFMKMEIQTMMKEKKNMETEFQEKFKNLENSLENLQRKENETQVQCRETLMYYKQQIEDYEQKINRYEKEKQCFLEEFEIPKPSQNNSNNFAWADSTVSLNPEERTQKSSSSKKRNKTELDPVEPNSKIFQCSQTVCKSKPLSFKRNQQILKKPKPQLEFLTQDSSVNVDTGRKRRLFSTNRNHYID